MLSIYRAIIPNDRANITHSTTLFTLSLSNSYLQIPHSFSPMLFLNRLLSFKPSFLHLRRSSMVLSSVLTSPSQLRGVVFDMDGTLTVPVIDFPAMYWEVLGGEEYKEAVRKGGGSVDILHCIEQWDDVKQRRAYEVIARFEQDGFDRLQIMPGALELCRYLDSRKIKRGLITRNVKPAVDVFHQKFGMKFEPALSREFKPYKPDPAPLLHICTNWNIPPAEVIMIGDSLKDDIVCGKRAGAFTCLLDETGRYGSKDSLEDEMRPDFKVSSLVEVLSILKSHFDLNPQEEAQEL